jgi:hypothetical protein
MHWQGIDDFHYWISHRSCIPHERKFFPFYLASHFELL